MRIREVTESRQLNEVAPLAFLAPMLPASLAWIGSAGLGTVALWAVSAVSTWLTIKDIDNAIATSGPNPGDWPEDLQFELLGQIVGAALFATAPMLKKPFLSAWSKMSDGIKRTVFAKVKPKLEAELAKAANKPAGASGGGTAGTKDPNRVDRPFSKDAAGTSPAKNPNQVERPFSKDASTVSPANSAGRPAPKNPNLVDRPYQKEELLRLAGLAK
jgi:hypothetical protein